MYLANQMLYGNQENKNLLYMLGVMLL